MSALFKDMLSSILCRRVTLLLVISTEKEVLLMKYVALDVIRQEIYIRCIVLHMTGFTITLGTIMDNVLHEVGEKSLFLMKTESNVC